MSPRILVAEDDRKQAELIRLYLERDGHTVAVVHDGRSALERIRRTAPDLVVLDLMMPAMDGLDVARAVRLQGDIPIVMVTARAAENDVLLGLEIGADDYVTKPFSPRELAARVRAVLRRAVGEEAGEEIRRVGPIEVDRRSHSVRVEGRPVECTPREFAVLDALASDPGRAYSRFQLLERAFGFDYEGLERTIDVHVMNLRRKIEPDPAHPRYLRTVYGVGYTLVEGSDA
jgi:DNA-binding response OmpR family regulator